MRPSLFVVASASLAVAAVACAEPVRTAASSASIPTSMAAVPQTEVSPSSSAPPTTVPGTGAGGVAEAVAPPGSTSTTTTAPTSTTGPDAVARLCRLHDEIVAAGADLSDNRAVLEVERRAAEAADEGRALAPPAIAGEWQVLADSLDELVGVLERTGGRLDDPAIRRIVTSQELADAEDAVAAWLERSCGDR